MALQPICIDAFRRHMLNYVASLSSCLGAAKTGIVSQPRRRHIETIVEA